MLDDLQHERFIHFLRENRFFSLFKSIELGQKDKFIESRSLLQVSGLGSYAGTLFFPKGSNSSYVAMYRKSEKFFNNFDPSLSFLDTCLISIKKNSSAFFFADRAYPFSEKFFEMSLTFQTGSKPVWTRLWTLWSQFEPVWNRSFLTQNIYLRSSQGRVFCDNKQTLKLFSEGDQTRVYHGLPHVSRIRAIWTLQENHSKCQCKWGCKDLIENATEKQCKNFDLCRCNASQNPWRQKWLFIENSWKSRILQISYTTSLTLSKIICNSTEVNLLLSTQSTIPLLLPLHLFHNLHHQTSKKRTFSIMFFFRLIRLSSSGFLGILI